MASKTEELSNLILEISNKFKQKLSCSAEDLAPDLTHKEVHLIEFIGKTKKTMGEISQDLNLTPGTITPFVDKLVNLKYLKRERDDNIDRRKIYISLDEKGKAIESILIKERTMLSKAVLKNMDAQEQEIVLKIFHKILTNLEND